VSVREGLVNNSTSLARINGCIPAISADERKNATSANPTSTNVQEVIGHDVILSYFDHHIVGNIGGL